MLDDMKHIILANMNVRCIVDRGGATDITIWYGKIEAPRRHENRGAVGADPFPS